MHLYHWQVTLVNPLSRMQSSTPIDNQNQAFSLAFDFVNTTGCHVFLTGKAGTGKTTFLRYLRDHTPKNMVIIAPTGVAAINAGGVTMHSFFQLPPGPFLPDVLGGFGSNAEVVNKHSLIRNLKMSSAKKAIIEKLELLVIDEVSMLRSDTLDAIDLILKVYRKNQQPFGGVQVLFIGDLYQLPPVVTDNEKSILDLHYQSPFFFDALILKQTNLIYLELKTIYRQKDEAFIQLLNHIRSGQLAYGDIEALNERYDLSAQNRDSFITLTTHNHKADTINEAALQKLPGSVYTFQGEIEGDFNEKQLPTERILYLKVGAQVMFIKNDPSNQKRYYNGKIGTIASIVEDEITVSFPDSEEEIIVERASWDQITYSYNKEKNSIEEKLNGQFKQYPLRLAWAITIHKSQGLTFDKAIIDAGKAFAPGQVYVALSRCRSLEGLILHSRIQEEAILTDDRISRLANREIPEADLQVQLRQEQFQYQCQHLIGLFHWQSSLDALMNLLEVTMKLKYHPDKETAVLFIRNLLRQLREQDNIARNFKIELEQLIRESAQHQDTRMLIDRTTKAIHYFVNTVHTDIYQPLQVYTDDMVMRAKMQKYVKEVEKARDFMYDKIQQLRKAEFMGTSLCTIPAFAENQEKAFPKTKREKGDSARESLSLFLAGKREEEIALIRKMAVSTIEGHLVKFIRSGELSIDQVLQTQDWQRILQAWQQAEDKKLNSIWNLLNKQYSFGQIRYALATLKEA